MLFDEINRLIASHREDDWWDFKREHHHDKAKLVHDILCMSNNRPRRDSYIIFGVDDEFSVVGVENDTNRRNQQGITDLLRNISFAGSVRPRIEIQTFTIENHDIDVLIIKDSLDVPYYLEKKYTDKDVKDDNGRKNGETVQPYHVYTRVVDNNTPIDKQADINDVEFLWRKRFGMELPILDRLHLLLNETRKWKPDWGNKNYCYHSDYPEFQIKKVGKISQGWAPAAAFYTDPEMHFAKLNITFHNTIIHETSLWSFDGYGKYLPEAKNATIRQQEYFWYSYYSLDSIEGKLLKIFTGGDCDISSREANYHQLLIFEDDIERANFESYIDGHFNDHSDDKIKKRYQCQIEKDNISNLGGLLYSAFQVAKIAWLYEDWKSQK